MEEVSPIIAIKVSLSSKAFLKNGTTAIITSPKKIVDLSGHFEVWHVTKHLTNIGWSVSIFDGFVKGACDALEPSIAESCFNQHYRVVRSSRTADRTRQRQLNIIYGTSSSLAVLRSHNFYILEYYITTMCAPCDVALTIDSINRVYTSALFSGKPWAI